MMLASRLSVAVTALLFSIRSKFVQCAHEVPHSREFFYVGGHYTDDGAGGHVFSGQMYVERLQPAHGIGQRYPIVFMHGQAQTGTNFLNKPDGGRGWASRFLEQGFELYIIDQTFRGRSAWKPAAGAVQPSTYSAEYIQQRFTIPQNYMLWPQAQKHTQWPGGGKMGDPVFDAFYSSNVQFINNATYQQSTVQSAGAKLLDRIGKPVILLGHSQGGLLPIVIADARPELTKAIILLEPTGPPFQEAVFTNNNARRYGLTDIPIAYSPPVTNPATDLADSPPPRLLVNLAPKPIIMLTSEASYHAVYDYCTAAYLKQAGCSEIKHLELAKAGILGNGHMMFMEKNSDEVQKPLFDWIEALD